MNPTLDHMISSILDAPMKRESFFHALLIAMDKIKVNPRGNEELKRKIEECSTFENILLNYSLELPNLCHYISRLPYQDSARAERVVRTLSKVSFNFKTVKINDSIFPDLLRRVEGAPPVLYLRGDESLLKTRGFAVVGTRNLKDADYFYQKEGVNAVEDLMKGGFTIVSGLAIGCDTLAHRTAMNEKGRIIAVLGTPLNRYYPGENRELQDRIAKEHLLISQYPVGIETQPFHFANRNMTIVGISSEGVLVITAGDKSGTLHAVKACISQGKDLYILPRNWGEDYEWIKNYKSYIKSFDEYYKKNAG